MAGNFADVNPANAGDASLRIQGSGTGQPRQDPERFFKLVDEHIGVEFCFRSTIPFHVRRAGAPSS